MTKYESVIATGYYETQRMIKFCIVALEESEKYKVNLWEEKIDEFIAKQKDLKKHWWNFLVIIFNREEASAYLRNDNDWYTTWDKVQDTWKNDIDQIKKISYLCISCNSHYIQINHELVSILYKWGLKDGTKIVEGI